MAQLGIPAYQLADGFLVQLCGNVLVGKSDAGHVFRIQIGLAILCIAGLERHGFDQFGRRDLLGVLELVPQKLDLLLLLPVDFQPFQHFVQIFVIHIYPSKTKETDRAKYGYI